GHVAVHRHGDREVFARAIRLAGRAVERAESAVTVGDERPHSRGTVATLVLPQARSSPSEPHPLLVALAEPPHGTAGGHVAPGGDDATCRPAARRFSGEASACPSTLPDETRRRRARRSLPPRSALREMRAAQAI